MLKNSYICISLIYILMDIKKTFVRLTNYTCPHGQESQYLRFLPKEVTQDEFGNYFMKIGTNSKSIFACHLDTVSSKRVKVKHIYDGKFIKTDGRSILGADDKAGLTVLLYMIHNKVPGLYYFFIGEEVGCVGSKKASKKVEFFKNYNKIVSFDRRDTHSVITYQSSERCCSDIFADALAKQLNNFGMNMRKDDTGVYTDSAEFTSVIPECTNISVGYYSEHTYTERQDIEHLKRLCESVVQVDWESLPSRRDPSKIEHKSYYGGYSPYSNYDNRWSNYHGHEYGYDDRYSEYEDFYNPVSTSHTKRNNFNMDGSMDYEEELDDLYPVRQMSRHKKNHISTTSGREFFDNGDGSLELLSDRNRIKWFENLKDKYLDDRLSDSEIQILKDQVLDMNDPDDRDFLKELEGLRNIKNFGSY